MTTQRKGYPFEVPLPPGSKIAGAVLPDQVRSLDWRARRARRVDRAPDEVLQATVALIQSLLPE